MGFIDKLRMNNIYGGGFSPLKPLQNMPSGDPMEEVIDRYLSLERSRVGQIGNMISNPAEQESMEPMNVAAPPQMTPYQQAMLNLRDRTLDGQESRAAQNTSVQRGRLDVSRAGQSLREWKAKNPNLQFRAIPGGNVMGFNPLTGERFDTGQSSGKLSEEDRLELVQENRIEALDRGSSNRLTEIDARGNIVSRQIGERGDQSRLTKQTAPGQTDKDMLPNQVKVNLYNRAKKFLEQYPSWAGKHIKLGSNNEFTLEQGKLTDVEYQQMYDVIYGDAPPKPKVNTSTAALPVNPAEVGKRNQAIEYLRANGKLVTEPNIKYVMGQIK